MSALAWWTLLGSWLVAGLLVAGLLQRAGQPPGVVGTAVLGWPLYLPMLTAPATTEGPLAQRIRLAFEGLRDTLAEHHEPLPVNLDGLEAALLRADARVARVDRLLAEAEPALAEELRLARDRSVAQVEAALAELLRVRVQVGLVALSQDSVPVQARLAELAARVRAIEEVGNFGQARA